uniref:Cystatin domain-containing protein n=1 Tax=Strongyloides stercoralis TaxID=6248 RepID=A0A0K0EEX5_STRER
MIYFKVLLFIIIFIITNVLTINVKPYLKKILYHDWKPRKIYTEKALRLAFETVSAYNVKHHAHQDYRKVLKMDSKYNGTKYYQLFVLTTGYCKVQLQCYTTLHSFIILTRNKANPLKVMVEKYEKDKKS